MKNLLLLLSFVFLLSSCKKEDGDVISSKSTIFRVNYTKKSVNGVFGNTYDALMYQEGDAIGTNNWMYLYAIEGFDFEPGYVYTLSIRKDKLRNPPQDASDTNFVLLRVLTKTKQN